MSYHNSRSHHKSLWFHQVHFLRFITLDNQHTWLRGTRARHVWTCIRVSAPNSAKSPVRLRAALARCSHVPVAPHHKHQWDRELFQIIVEVLIVATLLSLNDYHGRTRQACSWGVRLASLKHAFSLHRQNTKVSPMLVAARCSASPSPRCEVHAATNAATQLLRRSHDPDASIALSFTRHALPLSVARAFAMHSLDRLRCVIVCTTLRIRLLPRVPQLSM